MGGLGQNPQNKNRQKTVNRKQMTTGEGTLSSPRGSHSEEFEATPRTKLCPEASDPY
jgi:hypothetical protein